MNIKISPYTIFQRTEYSKIVILDNETNEKISVTNKSLAEQILSDYKKQLLEPKKYFDVRDKHLVGIEFDMSEEYIDYLFIPEEVTVLDDYSLESAESVCISLPSKLNTIESNAFYNCSELRCLEVPDSVKTIGQGAFESCSSLEYIKLPSSIEDLNRELFYGCTSLMKIDIPNSVKNIGAYAFCCCESLEDIKLPDDLKVINEGVFQSCESLENIILPKSLEMIDEHAFGSCSRLKEIILPDTVNVLGKKAFADCDNLKVIKLSNNISSLSEKLFSNCYSLKNIDIPKCLRYIDGQPFTNSGIKSLTFNYDLPRLDINPAYYTEYDLLDGSYIYKLIINKDVQRITSKAFRCLGSQITSIDYLGTKNEFKKFKHNNKDLFKVLPNIKEINFLEKSLTPPEIELLH